jgi:hypothetical protein
MVCAPAPTGLTKTTGPRRHVSWLVRAIIWRYRAGAGMTGLGFVRETRRFGMPRYRLGNGDQRGKCGRFSHRFPPSFLTSFFTSKSGPKIALIFEAFFDPKKSCITRCKKFVQKPPFSVVQK